MGISFSEIDERWILGLDPENVFWAALPKDEGAGFSLPDDLLEVYGKNRATMDREMKRFRFDIELNCIYIDPTDLCNASCPYCYIPQELKQNGVQMNESDLTLVMERLSTYFKDTKKRPVIVFHAAEPLMVKDIIFSTIKRYHKKFHFGIQTNGLLLTRKDVDFIKKYKTSIGLSMDAKDRTTNNLSRRSGKDCYEKVTEAIEWFDGYEGLNVIATVTSSNVSGLSNLVEYLHNKNVSCVLLNPVRTTRREALDLMPDQKEFFYSLRNAIFKAIELTEKTDRQIVIGNFANVILAIVSPFARRMMCDISPCGGGRTFVTIAANGDILPCGEFTGFREFCGGNILKSEGAIEAALKSEPFERVRNRAVENIEGCATCNIRNICGSPCPAEMYGRGDIMAKAEFCDFYKDVVNLAFQLIAQDKVRFILRQDYFDNMRYEYRL